ncbi:hypothetical protein D3C81_1271140 [compost metagenome]
MLAASALVSSALSASSSAQLVPRLRVVLLVRLQSSLSCQVAACGGEDGISARATAAASRAGCGRRAAVRKVVKCFMLSNHLLFL